MKIKRVHFSSIDSTNEWIKKNISLLDKDKITIFSTDEQTKGKGRLGRSWHSPKEKNLYLSFYFSFPLNKQFLTIHLTQLLAISISQVLENLGFSPKIKWPNDLLLSQKKICGILCETIMKKKSIHIILGLGLNINMENEGFSFLGQPISSLYIESGKLWSLKELKTQIENTFLKHLSSFTKKETFPFLSYLNSRTICSKKPITIFSKDKEWTGIYHSLNHDGSLNLKLSTNQIKTFWSGDILSF